jgi:secretin/TonB-like protein
MSTFLMPDSVVLAQGGGPANKFAFDIPSQPLELALDAYGAASRLQVLYESALTAGRRSAELKGTYTQQAALQQLLSGTGLDFNVTADRAFTLVLVPTRPPLEQSRPIADYSQFLGGVQTGLIAALCRRPETRPGAYRLALQFWIGGSGQIETPHLLSSTGVASRDAAITGMLERMALGQAPPAGMPQPITMVLRAGARGGDDECAGARR